MGPDGDRLAHIQVEGYDPDASRPPRPLMLTLQQFAEPAVNRIERSLKRMYPVEVKNEQGETRQAIGVAKGTVNGKEIVSLDDGTFAVNTSTGLMEYEAELPLEFAAELDQEAAENRTINADLKNVGDPAGHTAGTEEPTRTAVGDDEPEEDTE